MQLDFHYYASYCAAFLAGYSHEESLAICTSAQLVDLCSATLLRKLHAPLAAATTQLSMEMADSGTDLLELQNITRIWASFHFLPYDLSAERKGCSRRYLNKYRLICQPNGPLLLDTVELAKGGSLEAAGLSMHVLADTWAHRNFAGTPSLAINNTDYFFYELLPDGSERQIRFRHSASKPDDLDKGLYTNSLFQSGETSVMNLGHGRAGHLPDYSFIRYKYLPAWGDYEVCLKDNPDDYIHAFCQMIEALAYLRGDRADFAPERYAWAAIEPYGDEIRRILTTRQLDACADWKAFGKGLSGEEIPDFSLEAIEREYQAEPEDKNNTVLGRFIVAAMAQKSMVTNRIFRSGSLIAGFSVEFGKKGFRGIKDYRLLLEQERSKKL